MSEDSYPSKYKLLSQGNSYSVWVTRDNLQGNKIFQHWDRVTVFAVREREVHSYDQSGKLIKKVEKEVIHQEDVVAKLDWSLPKFRSHLSQAIVKTKKAVVQYEHLERIVRQTYEETINEYKQKFDFKKPSKPISEVLATPKTETTVEVIEGLVNEPKANDEIGDFEVDEVDLD